MKKETIKEKEGLETIPKAENENHKEPGKSELKSNINE